MKTTTRKSTRSRTAASALNLPFSVPQPINEALKTATTKVDALAAETRAVAGRLDENVRAAAENVRKQGQKLRHNPKGFMDEMVKDGRVLGKKLTKRADDMRSDISREAARIADDVTRRVGKRLDAMVETTLHRFNMPTHQELRALTNRVNMLSKKIDSLTKSRARAAR